VVQRNHCYKFLEELISYVGNWKRLTVRICVKFNELGVSTNRSYAHNWITKFCNYELTVPDGSRVYTELSKGK